MGGSKTELGLEKTTNNGLLLVITLQFTQEVPQLKETLCTVHSVHNAPEARQDMQDRQNSSKRLKGYGILQLHIPCTRRTMCYVTPLLA